MSREVPQRMLALRSGAVLAAVLLLACAAPAARAGRGAAEAERHAGSVSRAGGATRGAPGPPAPVPPAGAATRGGAVPRAGAETHPRPRDYVAEARASFTAENRAYQFRRVVLSLVSPLAGIAAGLLLLFTG